MATLAGASAREIVRLEQVAESVAAGGISAAGFAAAFRDALGARADGGPGSSRWRPTGSAWICRPAGQRWQR